ncbi:C3a anaphylatoxin chemotactic receptor-like [Mantella aurantiaca]
MGDHSGNQISNLQQIMNCIQMLQDLKVSQQFGRSVGAQVKKNGLDRGTLLFFGLIEEQAVEFTRKTLASIGEMDRCFGEELRMTNISLFSLFPEYEIKPPVFTILVMVVTFLVGIPGNVLVLWITSVKMKWNVNTIWFWNLAVADIICCLSLPLSIAQYFYYEWLYGPALCKVLPVVVHLNMFASVFTLVVISIDRCVLVLRPVWAQNHRSLQMAWVLCVVIWMLSLLMCLPAALYRKTFTEYNQTTCGYYYNYMSSDAIDDYLYELDYTDNVYTENHRKAHPVEVTVTITRMIFGFLIPFSIVSVCYLKLTFKVQNSRFLKAGRKATKVIFGIVIAFFLTWGPYHIIGIALLYFHSSFLNSLNGVSIALAYFNSCINPILYVFMGKDMKGRVRQSIRMLMESAFSEEVSRSTEHTRRKSAVQDTSPKHVNQVSFFLFTSPSNCRKRGEHHVNLGRGVLPSGENFVTGFLESGADRGLPLVGLSGNYEVLLSTRNPEISTASPIEGLSKKARTSYGKAPHKCIHGPKERLLTPTNSRLGFPQCLYKLSQPVEDPSLVAMNAMYGCA